MKKQVKREEIIHAAKKLIIEKGYRKTSVEDITREAGIAKGSFYTYFKSKDYLMETLLIEKLENRSGSVKEIIASEGSLEDIIREYVKYYLTVSVDDAEFILVMTTMMRSVDSVGEVVIERLEKDKARRKQEFINILKKFKDEVDIKEERDYERYGLLIFGMINTFYINNLFPSENRFVETSLTDVKNKISSIDFDYEAKFMTNILIKLVRK
ncbi:TetR/AcrR family transcriptional regulator [Fusobacterium perfoetens]|uniref:TetR/AcrR family transcriptional regulator n=1 Tax=Fusobacterium perfoetens TaxID=852 RepID=UPI001F45F132|nr:TetR/AcrR family transcriptional regulator [Fusobacterium perfoetens]MCF2625571.1 TetR/AcrR family transcriptional regulator [Fusobacterium perfoetens]